MTHGEKKVLIDCDVGVDDALALILAFHSPELKVEAITGVHGNVPLPRVHENIQTVLRLIQPSSRPVIAAGARAPLEGNPTHAVSVHGEDGLGGYQISSGENGWEVHPGEAAGFIPELARRYPDEITLVAIGPLTNLALGLERDREGMKRLKQIVIMGGAVRTGGNITPQAEFNFFVDPLAARIVLQSRLPITLVPLDVTHQAFYTPSVMEERIGSLQDPFSRFVIQATGYDSTRHAFRGNRDRFHLHDPLAVGAVIDPSLVKRERLALQVETRPGESCGQVSESPEGPGVEVCLGVDAERFLNLFLSRIPCSSGKDGALR